jgi:hypothetical protein
VLRERSREVSATAYGVEKSDEGYRWRRNAGKCRKSEETMGGSKAEVEFEEELGMR